MDSVQQNDYTLHAIKSQERILHDFIRKYIDIEARYIVLSNTIEQITNELNTKNNELENLKNLFQQATNSLEQLTIQNKNYESQINNFNERIAEKDRNYNELIGIKNLHESKHNEYKRECERLQSELQKYYDENVSLKQKVEVTKNVAVNTTTKKKNIKKTEDDF